MYEHHTPVLLNEVVANLAPTAGEVYVDGTFGAGGYSRAILKEADCTVYAIDRDPNVRELFNELSSEFKGRIELLLGNFGDMAQLLNSIKIDKVDGIVLDIGVSSMQIDTPERGFSFMHDGPLDMRMGGDGISAYDFVNTTREREMADIIYKYGGEKKSRRVARAIVEARSEKPISTTGELARIIRSVVRASRDKIDPATRTFQAIRIWVNDELGELERALNAAEDLLKPGGRLVVVSFHSLEDSIVKNFLNEKSGKDKGVSRHMPIALENKKDISFEIITKKALTPTDEEIARNIRSRSAKLRAARKTGGVS